MKPIRTFALLLPLLASGPAARASQYPLDQAQAIIQPDDARKLRKAGVRTTADLLTWGRTGEGRRMLADRAQVPVEQVTGWVLLADLMRVRGIGPDVARLLTAVGVRTLADLKKADPDATAVAVHDNNKQTHLSSNPPGVESIRYWVQLAAALPIVVSLD